MNNAPGACKEALIQLTIQAIENGQISTERHAIAQYNVPRSTVRDRRAGCLSRAETRSNTTRLTEIEEEVIVTYILDLSARGYPPSLAQVRDMADRLLVTRSAKKVGINWPSTFVKRRLELQMKFNRKYDYRRALCEDAGVMNAWFQLVENTKTRYGIQDEDT